MVHTFDPYSKGAHCQKSSQRVLNGEREGYWQRDSEWHEVQGGRKMRTIGYVVLG